MRSLLLPYLCLLLWVAPATASAQTIEVTDASGTPVLTFEGDHMKEAGSIKALYTIKGNIIFEGASDNQKDIKLLIRAENIFSKKKIGGILDASQKNKLFSIRDGGFYYRDNSTYVDDWMIAHFREEGTGTIGLYLGDSDTLLCRIAAAEMPTGKLAAVFYYFSKQFGWEEKWKTMVYADPAGTKTTESIPAETAAVRQTSGTIRKLWNTGLDEFTWDGEVLKRKWNSFDYEEWTFDGVTLKRVWYPGQEEMEWDGEVLRRKWYSSNDEFDWNGSVLRRRWGSATDGYVIQGHMVKPAYDNNMEREWEIDGNIPIPVIAIVVFGLLGK